MDEVTDPSLAIPVQGNKSYLIYGHDDFLNIDDQEWEENIYIDGGDIIYFFDPEAPTSGNTEGPGNPDGQGTSMDDDDSDDQLDINDNSSNSNSSLDQAIPNEERQPFLDDLPLYGEQTDRLIEHLGVLVERHDAVMAEGEQPDEELVSDIVTRYADIEDREMDYHIAYNSGDYSQAGARSPESRIENSQHSDVLIRANEISEKYHEKNEDN